MKIKKLKYSLVFLFCTLLVANAQDKTNQLNSQGKKEGVWKGVFDESKRPRYEGTFQNGTEVGVFKYFDDTKAQTVIATRTFSENGTVAQTTFYDQNNSKVSEGTTKNRLNEGTWNYYHKGSKQLMTVENYKNGKLEGIRKVYFKTGEIAEEAIYVNGKRDGIYKIYLENGVVAEESNFIADQYQGEALFRAVDGKISSKGVFEKNERKGIWEIYENGILIKKEKYPLRIKFIKRKNIPKP